MPTLRGANRLHIWVEERLPKRLRENEDYI